MNHLGTVKLETERLILRRAKLEDIDYAYTNWVTDSEVTKFLRWKPHKDIEETKKIFTNWIKEYENIKNYNWIIELKEIKEPIGNIAVVSSNDKTQLVHIGYALGRSWWNNGIMTEALKRLIKFFFEDIQVNRIESMLDPENISSEKVLKKSGMKKEGILRKFDWNNQGIVDAVYYSVIAEDYFI